MISLLKSVTHWLGAALLANQVSCFLCAAYYAFGLITL